MSNESRILMQLGSIHNTSGLFAKFDNYVIIPFFAPSYGFASICQNSLNFQERDTILLFCIVLTFINGNIFLL